MNKQARAVHSAIWATSAMTLFSYLFGVISHDDTREPVLLGKMAHRAAPGLSKPRARITGWVAHYAVGVLFAELYGAIWDRTSLKPTGGCGLVFGGLSGVAAILIWKITLSAHPFPPRVDFGKFAINLFFAHLIFGFVAAAAYRPPHITLKQAKNFTSSILKRDVNAWDMIKETYKEVVENFLPHK